MRRQLTAILCGCAVLWLTGCGAAAPATSGEPSRGQTMDLVPKEGDIRYEAALEEVSGESREGDVRLLTYRYEVPVLRAYRADGSELTGRPAAIRRSAPCGRWRPSMRISATGGTARTPRRWNPGPGRTMPR